MSDLWGWKRVATREIVQTRAGQPSIEELFADSSFKLPVRDVSSIGYAAVRVVLKDGKWVEEDEKERIWRTIIAASSR